MSNFPFSRMTVLRGLILTAAIALSGCYESNVKVLNYGDQANVTGSYACTSATGLFPDETIEIKETVVGSGEKIDYRYQVVGGGMFRFTEMDSGMMLAQTQRGSLGWPRRERDARYGFVFFDVRGSSGFAIHEAKFIAGKDDLAEIAKEHNVTARANKYGRSPTKTLTGTADEIFEFFNGHRRYMLQETASCSRAD